MRHMPKLIQQSVVLPAPPERLYDMYLDPAAHAGFTGAPVTISSTPHANVADHDLDGVTEGWSKFYWDPWRAYLQK
jgi:uncharacterized protein YndB with AHSA1/START domain